MLKIGIFGGTFDPIHLGHIHLANEVFEQCKLDMIYFIPCYHSAHNKPIIATPSQRLDMLHLAVNSPEFYIDDREIKCGQVSYTIDTLQSLRGDLPNADFYLIMGADAFLKFNTWRDWRRILALTNVIIADREEVRESTILSSSIYLDAKAIIEHAHNKIALVKIKPLPVSATQIRSLVKEGKNASYLLPEKVWQYIITNQLYCS